MNWNEGTLHRSTRGRGKNTNQARERSHWANVRNNRPQQGIPATSALYLDIALSPAPWTNTHNNAMDDNGGNGEGSSRGNCGSGSSVHSDGNNNGNGLSEGPSTQAMDTAPATQQDDFDSFYLPLFPGERPPTRQQSQRHWPGYSSSLGAGHPVLTYPEGFFGEEGDIPIPLPPFQTEPASRPPLPPLPPWMASIPSFAPPSPPGAGPPTPTYPGDFFDKEGDISISPQLSQTEPVSRPPLPSLESSMAPIPSFAPPPGAGFPTLTPVGKQGRPSRYRQPSPDTPRSMPWIIPSSPSSPHAIRSGRIRTRRIHRSEPYPANHENVLSKIERRTIRKARARERERVAAYRRKLKDRETILGSMAAGSRSTSSMVAQYGESDAGMKVTESLGNLSVEDTSEDAGMEVTETLGNLSVEDTSEDAGPSVL